MDMMFFAHVCCYIKHVKLNLLAAFRDFRRTYNVDPEQYEDSRCYWLFGEMSKEHREFCRTELKKLKAKKI